MNLELCRPAEIGLRPSHWLAAGQLLRGFCDDGSLPSAALIAGRGAAVTEPFHFGRQALAGTAPLRRDALFLVASITKPIVVMAALKLVERGLITLSDRVGDYLPGFSRQGKNGIRIRHLMTHTSGLPDMLPENVELRTRHAPLTAFVEGTCHVELAFPPGRGVSYQSMGLAVLGELIHIVSGRPCADFLRAEIFEPLGMHDSWLGLPESAWTGPSPVVDRVAEIQVPAEQTQLDWNWNSSYWRRLGAPWGGLLTTVDDLARFCSAMLGHADPGILSPAAIAAATRNQLDVMADVPEVDRRTRPWGLGWRLNWPDHSANFGDLLGTRTYGHWGATGTVLWIDPEQQAFMVLLTTRPQEPHGTYLARVSNVVASAF